MLVVKHSTTAACHPQTNGQIEWYSRTIVTRLRPYGAENQKIENTYVQPLTYAYNVQVHNFINTNPFRFVLSRRPPGPTTVFQPSALTSDSYGYTAPHWLRFKIRRKISTLQAATNSKVKREGVQYKQHSDVTARVEPELMLNQWLFVDKPRLTDNGNTAYEMAKAGLNRYSSEGKEIPKSFKSICIVVLEDQEAPSMVLIQLGTAAPGLRKQFPHIAQNRAYPRTRRTRRSQNNRNDVSEI